MKCNGLKHDLKLKHVPEEMFFFDGQCQMFIYTSRDDLLHNDKECSFDVFFEVFSLDFLFPWFLSEYCNTHKVFSFVDA